MASADLKTPSIWFTGLSGSGRSTLATGLIARMQEQGIAVVVLDADRLRRGLNSDLGFSPADRDENIRRVREVACLFVEVGVMAITASISPYRVGRDTAWAATGPGRFVEAYRDVPLTVCEARDTKGLYARARRGEIANFTGVSVPFEPPEAPDLTIRTHELTVGASLDLITNYPRQQHHL